MATIIALLGAVLIGLVAVVSVLVAGMRTHWAPATEAMRRLTVVMSKGQQGSGEPGATYGLLRHVGRSSGTAYETPLGIERTEDGFVIAIVYGERTHWVRNVLAAGSAEIVLEGETYPVERPEIVSIAEANSYIPEGDQRTSRLMGVTKALRLYHAEHD